MRLQMGFKTFGVSGRSEEFESGALEEFVVLLGVELCLFEFVVQRGDLFAGGTQLRARSHGTPSGGVVDAEATFGEAAVRLLKLGNRTSQRRDFGAGRNSGQNGGRRLSEGCCACLGGAPAEEQHAIGVRAGDRVAGEDHTLLAEQGVPRREDGARRARLQQHGELVVEEALEITLDRIPCDRVDDDRAAALGMSDERRRHVVSERRVVATRQQRCVSVLKLIDERHIAASFESTAKLGTVGQQPHFALAGCRERGVALLDVGGEQIA